MWSIRSNADSRSASRTHLRLAFLPDVIEWITEIASWHPRPGRNPYWWASSLASHSGSSALRTRFCWARSAMEGIPSGRSFPPFFGICTRRTGSTVRGFPQRCRYIASPARSGEVSATCPSTPGVRRPVLRWLTCRTLTSVLARLRSISRCRLRACFQSPACTALKILCRSRRTCSSSARQLTASQPVRSSGPFATVPGTASAVMSMTVMVVSLSAAPNLPIGLQRFMSVDSFKGPPGSCQLPFGPRHRAGYAASYTVAAVRGGPGHVPLLSCFLSAAAIRFLAILSRRGIRPSLRSAYRDLVILPDRDGVSAFRTCEFRPVPGVLSTPGPWCPHDRMCASGHHRRFPAAGPNRQ